jgi:hypothetical protein
MLQAITSDRPIVKFGDVLTEARRLYAIAHPQAATWDVSNSQAADEGRRKNRKAVEEADLT